MLIGIEASRANRLQKTGVEWYAYHLIQGLKQLPESKDHSWLLYTNEPLAMGLERGPVNWHEIRLPWFPKYLWTQIRLTWEMWRNKPEVLFVPAHVLPRVIPEKTAVTIHDIGFRRFPELYKPIQRWYHEWSTRDIVKRSAKILTVSEFSKQEIVDAYQADPDRISVVPLGIDHLKYRPQRAETCEAVLQRFGLSTPFVMFVGRLEKKKNVRLLVEAFSRYKERRGAGDALSLVLAGQPGVGFAEIEQAIQKSAVRDSIQLIGYASEEEKTALLSSAAALVHPSWYEGFGVTPIEAMACGCPVICSNATSLPEVVGIENALWFDPSDVEALANNLAYLMDHPSLREDLRFRGLNWCQKYDWHRSSQMMFHALTSW